jgi:hypothetical protein
MSAHREGLLRNWAAIGWNRDCQIRKVCGEVSIAVAVVAASALTAVLVKKTTL